MISIACNVNSLFLRTFLIGLILLIGAPPASAQDEDTTYVWANLTTVKSDRVGEFEELLRTRAAGLAEAGPGFRSVYQTVVGEQFTYLMVDFVPSIDVMDGPPDPRRAPPPGWFARNDATQTAQRSMLMRRYLDLRIAGDGSERDLVRIRIRRNAPGRTQDYYEWQANELLPALEEAGVTGFFINRVVLGGSTQTWVSFASIDGLASIEENVLAESMGERQATQLISRGAEMLVHTEDMIVRYRPDLSFVTQE